MREQVSQGKKANTSVSIPALKQPTRGFGLQSLEIAPQVNTETTEEPINQPLTHDISKISLRPQAKLSISQPGDFYEQQADSVAQQVMRRMAQPTNRHSIQRQEISEEKEDTDLQMKPLVNFVTPLVQRQQAPQEEEEAPAQDEEIQMKSMVQRRPGKGEKSATSDLETSIKQSRGGGQPLADDIKQPMEQAFGADFGSVRVHTDANSNQLNKSIQARAFTTGQDIFFRQGEYSPGNSTGKELLAHELTHVIQQNGSSVQPKTDQSVNTSHQKSYSPTTEGVIVSQQSTDIQRLCSECEKDQQQLSTSKTETKTLQTKVTDGLNINVQNINHNLTSPNNPVDYLQNKEQVNTEFGEAQEQETIKESLEQNAPSKMSGKKLSSPGAGGIEPPPADTPEQTETTENAFTEREKLVKNEASEQEQSVKIAAPEETSLVNAEEEANSQAKQAAQTAGKGMENPAAQGLAQAGGVNEKARQNPEEMGKKVSSDTVGDQAAQTAGKGRENLATQGLDQAGGVNEKVRQNPEEMGKKVSSDTVGDQAAQTAGKGRENLAAQGLDQQAGGVNEKAPQNPEEMGKKVSPETVAEKEQAINAVAETQTNKTTINTETAQLVTTGINFAPVQEQKTEQVGDNADLLEQQRVEASNISNEFLTAAALRVQTITELGAGISARIQGSADNAKALVTAAVEQQKAVVTAQIAQQRDQAQSEAQGIITQIQAQYQVAMAATAQTTAASRQKVETEYTTSVQKLAESENNQLARIEELYTQAKDKYRAAGEKVGNEAIAFGEQKASAWESQIKNQDDNFWDGPLTDNRLRARAKAARDVAQQYKDGLIQEANKQSDAVGEGKAKDIESIHNVANKSREQLETLQQQSLDNLNAVEQQVLTQLGEAQTQLTQTANQTLQATLQSLDQQQIAQLQLLEAYGQRQVSAIDRDAQKAIASIQDGINQAAANMQTVLQDTQNSLQGMEAPNPEELSASLAEILGQFDNAVVQVQGQTEQGIAASEQGITGGGQQAVAGISAIAQTGLQESAAVAQEAKTTLTNLNQGAVDTFNQIQQAFTTTVTKTSDTAVTGFSQTTQGVETAFNQVNQNLDSNFQKAAKDLEEGLRGALQGSKQPNLESDIEKYAQEAADQEQPRWKTVLKVLLVIAVIVVAIVVAPAVIGAVGAVAGALGASAAVAGGIGAVVGGAIVGAVAGAVIQIGNNAIDGKNLLDGVGKAALAGAIGGALGGAGGVLGNALGQAGRLGAGLTQSVLKFGIDVAFDIAGSIAGDLAVGNPITVEGILIGAGIGAAVQISTANLGRLGKFGRGVQGMQAKTFQAGEQFGSSLGNRIKSSFGGGVDAPKVGSPDVGVTGVKPPEIDVPRGDRPEVDTPSSTKSDVNTPSVKQPELEVKAPDTNNPSGRTTHLDEPEVEPGVVAKETAVDGHEIKVLKDGRVVRCSSCEEMDITPETAQETQSKEKLAKAKKEYDYDRLLNKIGQKQTTRRGREVTKLTEAEYQEYLSKLDPDQQARVEKAIKDYTSDSTATNNYLRGAKGANQAEYHVRNLDEMFEIYNNKGLTQTERVTYRLVTYKSNEAIPYGDNIKVGDYVTDTAYISASENRQLLVRGPEKPKEGDRYVKHSIAGAGGANISGDSTYTNANEKQAYKQSTKNDPAYKKLKKKFEGIPAGQAEILYPRDSVFKVEKIQESGGNVHVVLSVASPKDAASGVKNMFDGSPVSRGDRPEVDTPSSTKSDVNTPSVKQPELEVKAPDTNNSSGRTTHLDEPEVEPGIVAKETTVDGHEIKVLKDGRVVRCSDCAEIANKYKELLDSNQQLKRELAQIEAESNPDIKATKAKDFEQKLQELSSPRQPESANATKRPQQEAEEAESPSKRPRREAANKALEQMATSGESLAKQQGYGDAPDGYSWRNQNNEPILTRNPNKADQLIELRPDPKKPKEFIPVPTPPKDYQWVSQGNGQFTLKPNSEELPPIEYDPKQEAFINKNTNQIYVPESAKGNWSQHKWGDSSIAPCFPPGTLVKTPEGDRKIEDLVVGDMVIAYDFESNVCVIQPILELYKNWTQNLVDIDVNGELITATRTHPFWVESLNEWVPASKIQSGMSLQTSAGNAVTVEFAKIYASESTTYNLNVSQAHNYYVGQVGVLVHNGGDDEKISNFADTTKKAAKIYKIVDKSSGDPVIVYIGKTTQKTINDRFKQHLKDEAGKKSDWQQKYKEGELDIREIKSENWTDYETAVWEKHYIDEGLKAGYPLVNDLQAHPISEQKYNQYKHLHNPCS